MGLLLREVLEEGLEVLSVFAVVLEDLVLDEELRLSLLDIVMVVMGRRPGVDCSWGMVVWLYLRWYSFAAFVGLGLSECVCERSVGVLLGVDAKVQSAQSRASGPRPIGGTVANGASTYSDDGAS